MNRFVSWTCATLVSFSFSAVGTMQPGNAADTTVGVCEARNNTVRVYKQNGQLKLRAFDRRQGVTWLDTPAASTTNPEVVEYRNIRGETTVRAQFNRNSQSDCSIQIGNRFEAGRVTAGNPTGGDFGGSGGSNQGGANAEAIKAERTCLNKAKQSGYTVFQQTAAEKAASFHFVEMKGKTRNGRQYSFTCRYNNAAGNAYLENIQPVNPVPPRPQPR